ncbi:MAG: hypothetical protein QNJ46_13845 [Leptolyngbyaceae cyanobacterium MO_188.B28]|nr:hypothetical protein [Leptolyngbyaceae cyanobacterium MO_188.B28]
MSNITQLSRYASIIVALGLLIGCASTPKSTDKSSESDSSINSVNTPELTAADPQQTSDTKDANAPETAPENVDPTSGDQAIDTAETVSTSEFNLPPDRYCYLLDDENVTIWLRLEFDRNNQISGDSRSSIHNEEASYYSSAAQKFSGTLSGNKASLDVTTWVEYDLQSDQQTWTLSNDTLDADGYELSMTGCTVVDQAFKDINGLEASDLTGYANAVHKRSLSFESGASSATVSNSVIRGDRDLYTLRAEGGQQMTVSISSLEDNAVFDVVSPSGYVLAVEATEETIFLPHAGDQQVIVGGTRGNATYELTVEIR